MPRIRRSAFRALLAVLLAFVLALPLVPVAQAHATLVRSDPPANALLATAPPEVHLWLSEPLVAGISAIAVLDSRGRTAQLGAARLASADGREMTVALPPLPNGTYLVSWRAFSAVDGHTTVGAFAFSIGVLGSVAASDTASARPLSPAAVVFRWLLLLAQAYVVGAIVFRYWVWQPAVAAGATLESTRLEGGTNTDTSGSTLLELEARLPPAKASTPRIPVVPKSGAVLFFSISLALSAMAATGLFVTQIASGAEVSFGDLLALRVPLGVIFGSRLGAAWIGRMATLLGLAAVRGDLAAFTLLPPSPWEGSADVARARIWDRQLWGRIVRVGSVWLGAQLLLISAISSHSASLATNTWLSLPVLADWAHVIAMAAWAGGLLQFAVSVPAALRRVSGAGERSALTRRLALNFSTVAAFAVAAVLLSGVYLATLHVGRWEHLADTDYGRTLSLKIALVIPMLLLGAANLLWVKPRLEPRTSPLPAQDVPHRETAPGSEGLFWRLVTLEALAGVVVLAASGLLTELPRGADAAALGPGSLSMTANADDVRVGLTVAPARIGSNRFELSLVGSDGKPLAGQATASLRFVSQDLPLGSTEVLLEAASDGKYSATNATLNLPGPWSLEVAVRRAGKFDTFVPFEVFIGTDGRIVRGAGAAGSSDFARIFLPFSGLFAGLALIVAATGWALIAGRAAQAGWTYYGLLAPSIVALLVGANLLRRFFSETTPGALLSNPVPADTISLATGQTIYREKCADCHGTTGRADGPQAAGLQPRPPQPFRTDSAAAASDGDLFWWIKNGVVGSEMPAYRAVLGDEQVWSVVNYVRTLGAGGPGLSQTTLTPLPPTPTPPGGPLPAPGPSDEQAIALLDQVEVAMSALRYMREAQVVSDDAGRSLSFTYQYAAPDRVSFSSSQGQETMVIGLAQYYRSAGGAWRASKGTQPYVFPPTHGYTLDAVGAQYEGPGTLDGTPVEIVAYADPTIQAAFRLWVDTATRRILQLVMEAPSHHMVSRYDQFDVPVRIEPPSG